MVRQRACKVWMFLFFFFVGLLAATQMLWSQALTGDILGTVRDASGAVVPAAKVTLTQVDTGIARVSMTDANGNYIFAELKPADYRLEVSKEGFETVTVRGIELRVTQRPRIDVILKVGSVSQTVSVSAGTAPLLETQTSSLGQVIPEKPIVTLPLNGRDFIQLATLGTGVYPTIGAPVCSNASFATGAAAGTVSFTGMGFLEADVSYLIDGIETRGARWGNATILPSVDSIQEFKIQTQNYSADNGRSSIAVNVSMKSGANALHGSAFEFVRNSAFDGNDFFLNLASVPKPGFQQNDFGFSLGGPVVFPHIYNGHNKTFFFIGYEGIRSLTSETENGDYPSAAQLAGDLSDDSTGTGIFPTSSSFCSANPGSSKCMNVVNPFTGQPFPNNQIPSGMLNAVALKWRPYIHLPNVPVAPNQSQPPSFNFVYTPKEISTTDTGNGRWDEVIGSKDHFFASYVFDQRPLFVPGLAILGGETFPWRAQVLSANETHIFSPTVVNEFRFGYNRSRNGGFAQTANGPNIASSVFGFQNTSTNPLAFGVPGASIAGFSGSIGSYPIPEDSLDQSFQVVDNLAVIHGRHSIKMGGTIMHEKFYYLCLCEQVPGLNFTGQFSGTGLGDFLLGIPDSTFQSVGGGILNARANFYAGYLQDDFRARPNLTLNLGIRYEYQQWPQDENGDEETINLQTGQILAVFRRQIRNGIAKPDYRNVGPRVGFAYSPKFLKNTVIRSSFGIFYQSEQWNEFGSFAGFGPDFIVDQSLVSNPTTPTLSLGSLFPVQGLGEQNLGPNFGSFAFDPTSKTPYDQEWNFDVQHTFGQNWLAEIGYAGNVAQHWQGRRDGNPPSFDPTGTIPIQDRRPLHDYSFILTEFTGGWSDYHGLLANLQRKVSANGSFLASYTWAHSVNLYPGGYAPNASIDWKVYNRGNSLFVPPQRFSLAYDYNLPVGAGQHFLSGTGGAISKLISGWTVSGITTFQSGLYTTSVLGFDYMDTGPFSTSLPNKVGPAVPAHQTYTNWWNASAFALPGCPSLQPCATEDHVEGNVSRDLEQPGINDWDIALEKNTQLTERVSSQFRAEFFNAWNHTQFGGPNTALNSGIFGTISGLLIPPREIQLGFKLIW